MIRDIEGLSNVQYFQYWHLNLKIGAFHSNEVSKTVNRTRTKRVFLYDVKTYVMWDWRKHLRYCRLTACVYRAAAGLIILCDKIITFLKIN